VPEPSAFYRYALTAMPPTDGFAFVPHTVAVFPVRHPLGIGTERSPPQSSKEGNSQPDQRIIFDEFGRLLLSKKTARNGDKAEKFEN
jgi:hypothetical protein